MDTNRARGARSCMPSHRRLLPVVSRRRLLSIGHAIGRGLLLPVAVGWLLLLIGHGRRGGRAVRGSEEAAERKSAKGFKWRIKIHD